MTFSLLISIPFCIVSIGISSLLYFHFSMFITICHVITDAQNTYFTFIRNLEDLNDTHTLCIQMIEKKCKSSIVHWRDGSQNKTTKRLYLLVIHDPPTELTTWGDWFRCLQAPPCVGWACPRRRHSQCFGWRFLPKLCKWEREEKFDYLFEILPRICGQVC